MWCRAVARSVVNGQAIDWEDKDVFCVPGWNYHEHANASDIEPAVLFSFTEAPVLQALSPITRAGASRGASAIVVRSKNLGIYRLILTSALSSRVMKL